LKSGSILFQLDITMADCEVCCEKLNASNRKLVKCCSASCTFRACRVCAEYYLLDSTANPHCMACKIGWNREFMDDSFTKKFLTTEYKAHRENVLLEREKSMLPESLPIAEAIKPMYEVRRTTVEKLKVLTSEVTALTYQETALKTQNVFTSPMMEIVKYSEYEDKLLVISSEKASKMHTYCLLNNRVSNIEKCMKDPVSFLARSNTKKDAEQKRAFIRGCPAPECRGFLSTQWMCGLCDVKVCKDCHEIKTLDDAGEEEEHTCKKENLDTVAMLAKDTRHCPKCAANIFKIDGCDQMWCTQCHTAFSWRTGNIETHVHNPHYYEYLRQNGQAVPRAVGDNPCGANGELADIHRLYNNFKAIMTSDNSVNRDLYDEMLSYHRLHRHIRLVEIPKVTTNAVNDNQDLRIKYLLNEIDEKHFKSQLQQREKKNEKKRDIHNIFTLYQTVTLDIFNKLNTARTLPEWKSVSTEMTNLRRYINTCMSRISNRYGNCVVPIITEKLAIINAK